MRFNSILSGVLVASVAVFAGGKGAAEEAGIEAASAEEMFTYTTMGAVNLCTLSSDKTQLDVPADKALLASASMVSNVLASKHGKRIAYLNDGKPLPDQGLLVGSTFQIAQRSAQLCELKGEDKIYRDKVLEDYQKIQSSQRENS